MPTHADARASRPLSFLTAALWERASRLAAEDQHAAAAVELQRLIDIDPSDVDAGVELVRHLEAAGHTDRAADELLRLAGVYAQQDQEQLATRTAERALQLDPSRATRQRLTPLVARLGPAVSGLCEQVARTHMLAGRPELAGDVMRMMVEADPTQLSQRLRLAELDLAQGRLTEALAELRMVADGLRAHGRAQELVRVLEMMHVHGGANEAVLRELATIYVSCGQPRRALGKLEALHRIAPTDRVALERLARVHASLGRLSISVRLLARLAGLIEEQADRGELRAMLRRAGSWSSELGYQRALEDLGVRALRPGGMQAAGARTGSLGAGSTGPLGAARPGPRSATRRWNTPPPPLPRWTRRSTRPQPVAGEIHVLDALDAELVVDDGPATDDGVAK